MTGAFAGKILAPISLVLRSDSDDGGGKERLGVAHLGGLLPQFGQLGLAVGIALAATHGGQQAAAGNVEAGPGQGLVAIGLKGVGLGPSAPGQSPALSCASMASWWKWRWLWLIAPAASTRWPRAMAA